jgi:hypothetical protein
MSDAVAGFKRKLFLANLSSVNFDRFQRDCSQAIETDFT